MGGNPKKGGKGGGYTAKSSTGTLPSAKSGKRNVTLEAAVTAAAESDVLGQDEVEEEEEAKDVGSAALAAQARAKTTRERKKIEELARKLKALEEENAALKKVMGCSVLTPCLGHFIFLTYNLHDSVPLKVLQTSSHQPRSSAGDLLRRQQVPIRHGRVLKYLYGNLEPPWV
jgi:hypothetical protein